MSTVPGTVATSALTCSARLVSTAVSSPVSSIWICLDGPKPPVEMYAVTPDSARISLRTCCAIVSWCIDRVCLGVSRTYTEAASTVPPSPPTVA